MKKQKLDVMMSAVSFCISLLVFGIMILLCQGIGFADPMLKAIGVGGAFVLPPLAAFISMHISAGLRHKIKIKLPQLASVLAVVAILLGFAAGFVGQILYSLRVNEEVITEEISSDIVLMLDDSASMMSYSDTVRAASVAFVDGLSDDCRAAAGIFASTIGKFEELTYMDSAGKQKIKDVFDKSNQFAGGTDFNVTLKKAYDCLMANALPDRNKAVLMLTDGQAIIDDSIKSDYLNNDITLYTIRISGSEGLFTDELVDFVNRTGGFDTVIDLSSGSMSGIDDLTKAFEKIPVSSDVERTVDLSGGLLIYDANISMSGFVIRVVCLIVLAVSVQILYFRRMSVLSFIGNVAAAIAAGGVITIGTSLPSVWIVAAVTAFLLFTAYVRLNLTKGADSDV